VGEEGAEKKVGVKIFIVVFGVFFGGGGGAV